MAPNFITSRLASCAGTPVHTLICGHTIHASFLHPTTSSKCAPNCKNVNIATNAEPNFLCPTCYDIRLRENYRKFMSDTTKKHDEEFVKGTDIAVFLREMSEAHDSGDAGENREFARWCHVGMHVKNFEKAARESYKWKIEAKGLRGCSVVEGAETE
jgi:hypothetical protein